MAEAGPGRLDSIGACMPGLVDPSTGVVRHAVNLGVETLNLAEELEELLGTPVAVENDVKAAALGAHGILAARRAANRCPAGGRWLRPPDETLAYLNLGTGLAAGVVRNGKVLRGPDGMLGEIGHLPVGGDTPCVVRPGGLPGNPRVRVCPRPDVDSAAGRRTGSLRGCARRRRTGPRSSRGTVPRRRAWRSSSSYSPRAPTASSSAEASPPWDRHC